jgi:glycosyltransferase involved in cell wall biosynthesis
MALSIKLMVTMDLFLTDQVFTLHKRKIWDKSPGYCLSSCRGEWTIIMDADLQDSPEDVPALLSKGQEGFDAVFAARRGIHESYFRLLTSRVFKGIMYLLCGMNPDTGTFVAINRSIIDRLLTMHGPYPYVPGMIHCTDQKISSVPVHRVKRSVGKSSYSVRGRIKLAWRALSWVISWKLKEYFKGLD